MEVSFLNYNQVVSKQTSLGSMGCSGMVALRNENQRLLDDGHKGNLNSSAFKHCFYCSSVNHHSVSLCSVT